MKIGISVYSAAVSVLFFNLLMIAVSVLRRSKVIRAKNAPDALLFATLLGVVRLLTPLDWSAAHIIRSYRLLPALRRALNAPVLGSLGWGSLLLLLWAAGTLVFLLRDFVRLRRFALAEKAFPLHENEQISRIAAEFGPGFTLKISPEIRLPFVTGLFRPVVYVPDLALSDEQWRNVFRHETQHVRSRDEWKKLIFRGIRALFWWNPLLKLSEEDISLLIELQCDARVAGKGSAEEQEDYLRTMLELMKRRSDADDPVGASGIVGKRNEMKLRFESLLTEERKSGKRLRLGLSALMLAAFAASYFVIVQPAAFPSEEEILANPEGVPAYSIQGEIGSVSAEGPGGNDFILHIDGRYRLYLDGGASFFLEEDEISQPPFCDLPIYEGND